MICESHILQTVAHKSLLKVAGKWAVANANCTLWILDECTTVGDTFVQVWPSDPRLTKIRFVLLIIKLTLYNTYYFTSLRTDSEQILASCCVSIVVLN